MMKRIVILCFLYLISCEKKSKQIPEIQYSLNQTQTHNKFSKSIKPVLTVKSGSVIEVFTEEATDGQFNLNSSSEDVKTLNFEPIHPLTGPVFIEEAEVGDILAVTLHKIELGDWGWTAIVPGFGFLADQFTEAKIKTFKLGKNKQSVMFNDEIEIPLNPFPGVMGVAPDTEELLSTIPPRSNGGNMDDPNIIEGTTVYFPVLVKGALFSIGDTHAVQGLGEICGTALEAPMRIVYEVKVIKSARKILEPQYERDDIYAVTAFGKTIDEAAKKASKYMIDYLSDVHGLSKEDAYMLCSLSGNLHIAEVVDVPHMLVTMHIPKNIFKKN
jgi:acetamidase/formamidase